MILTNPFVEVVNQMNGIPKKYEPKSTPELRQKYQERQVALYITMQDVLTKVTQLLGDGEKIVNFLPMTNEDNTAAATDGIMGMYAPQTDESKEYIKAQDSLRGNRLMVFTNQRIIFFIVVEFIDDQSQYFSYEYDQMPAIKFKKHQMKAPKKGDIVINQDQQTWYTLDFETKDGHVFQEFLTADNGKVFKQNLLTIPAMSQIRITNHATRNNRFDLIFGNILTGFTAYNVLAALILLLMLISLLTALLGGA
ncbi:hypothetical protein ACFQ4L_04385 [Lapidilactobacillus mulanensis]|uniref:Uncharacterized protein n=1 Tax=Lapidilactobacillus mulanensis TaxID=2485999 RepID=A0ABW4DMR5_9LACO|nr:hypothetical protein [Lapidilactobacillus mulanensis]